MNKKLIGALIGVVSATSLIATTAPASAYTERRVYYQDVLRGSGRFEPHGEIITVKDLKKDGLGVWVRYTYYRNNIYFEDGWCINQKGAGTTVTCNLSIAEGTLVTLDLRSMDGSEPRAFVGWQDNA